MNDLPYKAILHITIEVHPVKDGKCTGQVVSMDELRQYGINPKQLIFINGENKCQVLTRLVEKLNQIRQYH